ncbi:methylenetetrahydrofolate reductase [Aquella oligotrophica]|uniref:Methylenetetrahydrofolate reductase n=1 Tax=Aquella oligotrophica TaxID=2067065 RepID=A0A2I7N9H5_9NEIS|nr:methylenetetrahydrofolate reductase [Aquella oligotrophica]AUR53109.1 methylenetetrahydrofolate reductase [NAD(P)H] [Aquella oligotrophica]
MRVSDHLSQAKKTLFSYEIVPPLRGSTPITEIFSIIEKLLPYDPKWINVTTHASSLLYVENSDGTISKRIHKKRPGTMGICGVIQNKYGIDAVAHVLCQGFSQQETEDALIELNYMGIENILALKGDNLNYNRQIADNETVNRNAVDLVRQVAKMRDGKFIADTEYPPVDFCMGVAGYPEKHFEAANMQLNIDYLKQKVAAGAEYVITQMFFDNDKYFAYVDACRAAGINVPIIPGIKVIKTANQLNSLPRLFHIDLPHELVSELVAKPEHAATIGKEWAKTQVKDLIARGAPCVHFFLMNDVSSVLEIIKDFN